MKAVCSKCLGVLAVAEDALTQAIQEAESRGKRMSTVFASEELAFPGMGLPRLKAECAQCGKCVPIAVEDEVAATLPPK